jgi:hypothetical protein
MAKQYPIDRSIRQLPSPHCSGNKNWNDAAVSVKVPSAVGVQACQTKCLIGLGAPGAPARCRRARVAFIRT